MTLGYLDRLFKIFSLLALVLIYIPVGSLILTAFQVPSELDPQLMEFSLAGFKSALNNEELRTSLFTSLQLSTFTATTTTIFALILAYGLQGCSSTVQEKIKNLFSLPLMLPEIIIGLSLLIWFVFIHVTLGPLSLWISHVTFTLPYGVLLLCLGIENIEESLFEAGKDLGASKSMIFKKITLPLLKPSLISVFLLSFVISFDDFLISYFTNGPGNDTLPVKLYSLMRFGVTTELKAISTLVLGMSFFVTLALFKLMPREKDSV